MCFPQRLALFQFLSLSQYTHTYSSNNMQYRPLTVCITVYITRIKHIQVSRENIEHIESIIFATYNVPFVSILSIKIRICVRIRRMLINCYNHPLYVNSFN